MTCSDKDSLILTSTWTTPVSSVGVYPRRLRAWGKKRTSPDCLKIRRNCMKTLDFSISIYILLLISYSNAFTCSWYVSNTYHSPVKFHINSTYCIGSTPVYWSKLGRSCYGTDTYVPSSYSRLGVNICSVRVPSLPIWWRHKNFNQSIVLLCCVNLDEHRTSAWPPDSFFSVALRWAVLQAAT